MADAGARRLQGPSAREPQTEAEIHILHVTEIASLEAPEAEKHRTTDQHCSGAGAEHLALRESKGRQRPAMGAAIGQTARMHDVSNTV
jgi:hypothetical protein